MREFVAWLQSSMFLSKYLYPLLIFPPFVIIKGKRPKLVIHGLCFNLSIKSTSSLSTIKIGHGSIILNTSVNLLGNGCSLQLGSFSTISRKGSTIDIEDDNSTILIGDHSSFYGPFNISSISGCTVRIGDGCAISPNVKIRNGDSHFIYDQHNRCINQSTSIFIADNVWICEDVTILKGVTINSNSVIGARSLVLSGQYPSNTIYAGCPAKKLKTISSWSHSRYD